MKQNYFSSLLIFLLVSLSSMAQNFSFNFGGSGRRVCLVSTQVDVVNERVKIIMHDSASNNNEPIYINRRQLGTYTWTSVASALPAGTGSWIDNNVNAGEIWEYQVRRQNTWNFQSINYDAIGYTIGALQNDNAVYKGEMILLVANDVVTSLPAKYNRLKKELTADGWFVNELVVPRASNWDSGNEVVTIKNQIMSIYNNAPTNDKPKALFILGHVALPRSGSTSVTAPDEHDENQGARGCDAYYADMDGIYTDTATFNPGSLATPLAINLPGDFKWDQDFFPSDVEMGFGRVDFADLTDLNLSEMTMLENYLDRLSNYRNVAAGYDMGDKTGFYYGYDNSNDGTYRSLPNISTPDKVYQNYAGPNHNQWVQSNGPFKMYMQNLSVPDINDWVTYGMDAAIYSSDQSYWGFGDVPQSGIYSRVRSLLGADSKCVVTLWTTTGINIFHQACTGQPLGIAMQEIMNHNSNNQYLEKAPQQYDEETWWNRTHFAFYGDPLVNLYQISPPSNITLSVSNGNAVLQWVSSPDAAVMGYHIYESSTEFGKFQRISNAVVNGTSFTIPNYQTGHWYMVKAVKIITSGCGQFIHTSIGKEIQGTLLLGLQENANTLSINVFPNPSAHIITVQSNQKITQIELFTITGQRVYASDIAEETTIQLNIATLAPQVYFMRITSEKGKTSHVRLLKTE